MALNKCIFTGRLVSDPEPKQTNSGVNFCTFTIAVDRPYKQGEEKESDFVNFKAWRGTADFICKHFQKGKAIEVVSRFRSERYTDQDGNKKTWSEFVVENVNFSFEKRNSGGDSTPDMLDEMTPLDDCPF